MSLDERLVYFVLGCILGYILASIRHIKKELHEVDEIVKKEHPQEDPPKPRRRYDESGFMRHPVARDIAVVLTVLLTAFAAFASQKAANNSKDAQQRLDNISSCNKEYLQKTIVALNERTTFTQQSATANVDLQTAQAQFFAVLLHKPPFNEAKRARAAEAYSEALNHFLETSQKTRQKVAENPFPTDEELAACLAGK